MTYSHFADDQHRKFYEIHSGQDVDRNTFHYLVGISGILRNHYSELYDIRIRCIKLDALRKGWQTSSTRALTRLAFDTFHGGIVVPEDMTQEEDAAEILWHCVPDIFSRLGEWVQPALYCLMERYR